MDESLNARWEKAKELLKRDISGPSYDAWFRELRLLRAKTAPWIWKRRTFSTPT